ncbi:class I SAM-dependent methyltransferase [Marinovum sp. 2_MG-2023]|uniref:class I SAM-dependent methyltransferase n=1 Tax=unclassified Marinovum TaxID=2647166 RepID=UPI0026E1BC61|nr:MULTISPECIES: class I SAM-dependent methyltransferase [unclassified Marinovum]MDO6730729.1 class I SAM-dependent methyltransferase [Marinovum sp. 2_MG-2023]MDO6780066.1 class I SAM-dependent methyltransferase [Marinovum sp. 1_MG-2023]
MVSVKEHYEAYPYPERNPKDEGKRLITGSPSHPVELDHYLFAGQRDWTKPLRVLVAGGGTGDGLIQLAHFLKLAKRPHQITYVDLSTASRAVAEERASLRGVTENITFHTASLLDAADFGDFDYIDCCGVLHHLPDPDAGFRALRAALAPGGGMGFMVYAPLGRSGVYPLQAAFGAMFADLPPKKRLKAAKAAFAKLPEGHPFKRNPHLGDHRDSDAGFYDLLLHGQDRAYDVPDLVATLGRTGWALSSFTTPSYYDPTRFAPVPAGMDPVARMALAEQLCGSMRLHIAYAVAADASAGRIADGRAPTLVPHLIGVAPGVLAKAVAEGRPIPVTMGGERNALKLPRDAAPLLAQVNGRHTLGDIAKGAGLDPIRFAALWGRAADKLSGWGLLLYSGLLR